MIDERMEEQASLYVLGVLTPEETRAFEAALRGMPNCNNSWRPCALRAMRWRVLAPQVTPPPALKQKILAQIAAQEKVVSLPVRVGTLRKWAIWLPWALAACLAIVCGISLSQQKACGKKMASRRSNWPILTRWLIRCITKRRI